MTQTIKPYAEYRDSGVPWLGAIPAHWGVERGKMLYERLERPAEENDEVVTCFRDGMVTLRRNRRLRGFTEALKEVGYQGVRSGDLVIHAMDAFAGAIGVSDSDGKCTPMYAICQSTRGLNNHYYAAVLREMARDGWILALAKGIRERSTDFRFETAASQYLPVPPIEEQNAIETYLAVLNQRTNALIRTKRRLIELLNEQKQAIIHRAVTRGLDSDVRLKPSGVEWLGDVPEHWRVLRCRYLVKEIDQRSIAGTETHLSMSQKHGLVPRAFVEERRLLSESYVGAKLVEKHDIVLNRLKAHLGVFALASEPGLVSPDYTVLRPLGPADGTFLEYVFRSQGFRVELRRRTKGIVEGFWRLYTDDLYDIQVPVPDNDEQDKIVRFIESTTFGIAQTIARTEQEIDLIREYRTRLVADVVTGKVDVRDAAVGLPVIGGEGEVMEAGDLLDDDEFEGGDEFTGEELAG